MLVRVSDPATPGAPPTASGAVPVSVKSAPVPAPLASPAPSDAPLSPFEPTPAAPVPGQGLFSSLSSLALFGGGSSTKDEAGRRRRRRRWLAPARPAAARALGARLAGRTRPAGRRRGAARGARRRTGGHRRTRPPGRSGGPAQGRRAPADGGRRQAVAPPAQAAPPVARVAAPPPAPAAAPVPASPAVLTGSSPMWHELDKMQNALSEGEEQRFRVVAGTASFVSVGASVLYLAWILRAGSLVSSLLSSMPAWQFVDPLPILDQMGPDALGAEGEEDDESLQSMVEEDAGHS